jgi:hypothetical protein
MAPSFTIVRLRYLISLHNSGHILLAKGSVVILLATQSIGYDIGLSWVMIDSNAIILNQLEPSKLPQIQISLGKNVLETLVVAVNLTSMADEVMSPYLESVNHCR